MGKHRRAWLLWIPLLVVSSSTACLIPQVRDYSLAVPYRQWVRNFYCGPASILMWRLYDGGVEIDQDTIGGAINWPPAGGSPDQIALGVRLYSNTGGDAIWDLPGGEGPPLTVSARYFSRQIASLDGRIPVIGLIRGDWHAGVVNGGHWHENVAGLHVWDYVYFHDPDPSVGPDYYYSAASWTMVNSSQILASRFAPVGDDNFWLYGDSVVVRGRTDWDECRTRAACD
jgi:hypothetical protein